MLVKIKKIRNADIWQSFGIYSCDRCGQHLPECDPRHDNEDKNYCHNCAYILNLITEDQCKQLGYFPHMAFKFHLDVVGGEVVFVPGKRKTNEQKDCRSSPEYARWRLSVFERDNFTCCECGKTKTKLNAHHILSYKKHPDKRLELDNGVTLCISCHKEAHRRKVSNG